MIWNRNITDVKRSGFDRKCDKCRRKQVSLIRVTFDGTGTWRAWFDKYICDKCWLAIARGRKFNLFNQQVA